MRYLVTVPTDTIGVREVDSVHSNPAQATTWVLWYEETLRESVNPDPARYQIRFDPTSALGVSDLVRRGAKRRGKYYEAVRADH